MWKEDGNTSSFTSLSYQHEQASHTNKDSEMLVLKNKINSYYCKRLIWALISILILSSQDTAAHVSSPQESPTAAYQYIMDNAVCHTKSIFRLRLFHMLHYDDPRSSNFKRLKYLLLTLPFKSKARTSANHAFAQRCCTNTEVLMIISANQ